ncbi:MAG: Dyp-type peroxidase, partial [Pseudomonadota bacterium]
MPKLVSSKSLAGPSEICMLMPIRQGFTPGLATRTYESRLRSFTKLFSDLRAVTRESRRLKPFSDIVDRLRTILGVTISIVDGQLLLVVHFDRPWEPYIRLVWRDLGHVFDLILCNCEGYVEAHRNNLGFEAFAGWIRKYQVDASTFYTAANYTVDDVIYLDRLEKAVRHDDADAATLAKLGRETPEERAAAARSGLSGNDYVEFIKMGVQAVAAFHALTFLYPKGSSDHNYLLRTARAILPPEEFPRQTDWDLGASKKQAGALRQLQGVFSTELNWFELWPDEEQLPPPPEPALPFDPSNVQGGIASSYGADVGCLILLQVLEPAAARRFLDGFAQQVSWAGAIGTDGLYRNVAFTAEGLTRLELPEAELEKLPAAFREGMANRAGLIGDLRDNHPDQWSLPARNWPPEQSRGKSKSSSAVDPWQTVNLEAVDVVIQLRRHSGVSGDRSGDDPELMQALERLAEEAADALLILGYQSMYSQGSAQAPREHFGFRDGISNPRLDPDHPDATDVVPAGDLFLGQPNGRRDRLPEKWSEPLFKDGSFQVVRKLSQDVRALHEAVDANLATGKGAKTGAKKARDTLLAKMMGRDKQGVPLADPDAPAGENGFDYGDDPHGDRVPTFAHVRRANPRDQDKDGMPRIVRRGMSYGPSYQEGGAAGDADRGLIFQAYNASLDEQFEVINRWLAGDNRTAPYSRLSDPFLGVPERGESRVYRFADGGKLDLGEKPFVRLCWGLYLFT